MAFPLLIFTDLDGTLLDHHSYSLKGAEETLQRLRQHGVPVILTSSKTRAELQALQGKLGFSGPFIAENGGSIFIPADYAMLDTSGLEKSGSYYVKQLGRPYSHIRAIFTKLQSRYRIRGFGDMTAEEIMALTGLPKADALLALQRDCSEPFFFLAEPRLQELEEELVGQGLTVTRGGRFYHLMAAGQDKGRAVAETTRLFQAGCPEPFVTVGLGDAENDYPMLKVVDIPVLIPKPDETFTNMDLEGLRMAPYPGSRGWGAAVTAILHDFLTLHPGYAEPRMQ